MTILHGKNDPRFPSASCYCIDAAPAASSNRKE